MAASKPLIVLISGKQGSGKSTLAAALVAADWRLLKFAWPLYEMHDAVLSVAAAWGIPCSPKEGVLLQLLGTEWGRGTKGEDVWVAALKREAMLLGGRLVIDDCRFPNELAAWDAEEAAGEVTVVRIMLTCRADYREARTEGWRGRRPDGTEHPSETALDGLPADRFDLHYDTSMWSAEEVSSAVLGYLNKLQQGEQP